MGRTLRVSIVVGSLLLAAASAAAQTVNGVIEGRLTNTRGGPMADVFVALTGPALSQPATATTGPGGEFRFDRLADGLYRVTASRLGFHTLVHDRVRVTGGATVRVQAALVPVATQSVEFDRRALETAPAARDPWAIALLAPALVMSSGVNVGGSASGNQLQPAARGQGITNASWFLDGVNVTDLAAVGGSKFYFTLDAIESMSVTTAGGDASVQTAGPQFRLAMRSGTDRVHGSARHRFANDRLQSVNVTPGLFASGAGAGVPLKDYREYGGDIGGPLWRDRLWGWFTASGEDIVGTTFGFYEPTPDCLALTPTFGQIDTLERCLLPDSTTLRHAIGRVTARIASAQMLTVTTGEARKSKNARFASSLTQPESTGRQSSRTPWVLVAHRWDLGRGLLLESRASRVDHTLDIDFQTPELAATQVLRDLATSAVSRSFIDASFNRRPAAEVAADGTWALPARGPGRHTVMFGVGYRQTEWDLTRRTGGNVVAQVRGTRAESAQFTRDGQERTRVDHTSAYVQDSFALGRLRLNGGVRWDLQDDRALPSSVPANPIVPERLPAAQFGGINPAVSFSDVAPRISAALALDDESRTVLHAAYGAYFGQGISVSRSGSPTRAVSLTLPWGDLNGDRFVQAEEVATGSLAQFLDPATGLALPPGHTIDPNLRNPRTREAIAGVTREIGHDLSVSASYIRRIDDRFIWTPRIGDSSDQFVEKPWTDPVTGLSSTYFEVAFGQFRPPNVTHTTNQPGRRLEYDGLDLSIRKRYRDRWALDASVTAQRSVQRLPAGSYIDPTDVARRAGRPGDPFLPRFIVRLSGQAALPAGVDAAVAVNVQDGFIREVVFDGPMFRNGLPIGSTLLAAPFGAERYPTLTMVDLRVERAVALRGRTALVIDAVVFNLFNANTVLQRVNNLSATNAGRFRISSVRASCASARVSGSDTRHCYSEHAVLTLRGGAAGRQRLLSGLRGAGRRLGAAASSGRLAAPRCSPSSPRLPCPDCCGRACRRTRPARLPCSQR